MNDSKLKVSGAFSGPTAAASSPDEERGWQDANRSWWQENPMRYDWNEKISHEPLSRGFFKEVDGRFFSSARDYLDPHTTVPFDEFIRFDTLAEKDVLEVGVGIGSHAELFASHARSFTGIDLTDYAVKSTKKRMELSGISADIRIMDAEKLDFNDRTFDFIWSWGVIHHSSNTRKILGEIQRVLRPGGEAVIMVYYRGWWNYYVMGVLEGIASGNLFKTRSLARSVQLHTDGALARYYSKREWKNTVGPLFTTASTEIRGQRADIIPLPAGSAKNLISSLMPLSLVRFLTRTLCMGGFLISRLKK